MDERRITVPRSARYYTLGTADLHTDEIWLVLHGFGQLAGRFLKRFQPIERPGRVIAAPEALNRFYVDTSTRPHSSIDVVGATWMTREDRQREIIDYVSFLDLVHGELLRAVAPALPRLTVFGFSQGVATAARWATLGAAAPSRIILWSGNLPPEINFADHDRWRSAEVSLVWGTNDKDASSDAIQSDSARLSSAGVEHQLVHFEGGHAIDPETLARFGEDETPSSSATQQR